MSLNGLDDARVTEAHEAAIAEPGGWFLLKYASRDEVELLGRGTGGIVELRNNIAQYEEKSPLYGFLRYRRRSVIIKYLPEDCSRLIQAHPEFFTARVTVHFEAVCDRFSPHDTTFEISEAKELKDTKLSAACSLHAATGSTSSSTSSLRRRRLMEIAEEEEEEERERKRQSVVKEEARPKSSAAHSETAVKLDADLAKLPDASRFANELEPPNFTGVQRPSSPAKSFDESSRRMSSQSSRTDLYPTTSYPYSKPRVKLGPRPSADPTGRPRSSAGGSTSRVSTVPAGLKSMSKGSRKGRSQSQSQDDAPESLSHEKAEDVFQPIETVASGIPGFEPAQSQASSATEALIDAAVAHKTSTPAPAQPPAKQNTMTPEKARLLKAMKLREKKKMMSLQPALDVPSTDIPTAPSTPGLPDDKQDTEAAEDAPLPNETPNKEDEHQETAPETPKPDSAMDLGTDNASVDTPLDSHPSSPAATSEIGGSTQASSLSDSTDETILAKDEHAGCEREERQDKDDEPLGSTQSANPPAEEYADGTASGLPDRQSQATITAPKSEVSAVPEDKVEEPAASNAPASDAVVECSPPTVSTDTPGHPSVPDKGHVDQTEAETVDEPAPAVNLREAELSDAKLTGDATASVTQQIRIPVSKFSTQETRPSTNAANQGIPSITAHASDVDAWRVGESAPPVPEKDTVPGANKASDAIAVDSKLRKLPERIRTDLEGQDGDKRRSVISILDNDGLMDELQSATVQQATPVTVSKSPMSPLFGVDQSGKLAGGGTDNTASAPKFLRTVSNPVRNSFLAPNELPSAPIRSASSSSTYLQRNSQQQPSSEMRPKSAKLGSSISQRIKALEKLSERPATTFFAVRKTTERATSRDSSSPDASRSMGRGRSGSLVNRLSMFEGGMPPRGRPESVQVTARIGPEPRGGQTDYGPLDLRQSPPVHQAKQSLLERRLSKQSREGDRDNTTTETSEGRHFIKDRTESIIGGKSPSTDNLGNPLSPATASQTSANSRPSSRAPSVNQPSSLARRLSISSRRSSIEQNGSGLPAAALSTGPESEVEAKNGSALDEKKLASSSASPASPNKTSRASRKNENAAEVEAASRGNTAAGAATQPSIVAFMGDVNVQFPDNLLWKRRSICLDSQGFLILSAGQGTAMMPPPVSGKDRYGALVKRYHMSDFKPPFAPDVELQELPNSVVLDLVDGSGLQIACEDRAGQMSILRILEEAHRTHANY
ncbi:hypothetical protein P885DRAFT_65394 [Corynascus similis CBS 632.67]